MLISLLNLVWFVDTNLLIAFDSNYCYSFRHLQLFLFKNRFEDQIIKNAVK